MIAVGVLTKRNKIIFKEDNFFDGEDKRLREYSIKANIM